MEINPNRPIQGPNRSQSKKRTKRASQAEGGGALADGVTLAGLQDGLRSIPDIRQEQIDTGRRLAGDPDYPDAQQLRDLGELIYLNYEASHPRHGK